MPDPRPSVPRLGGSLKDIIRERQKPKPKSDLFGKRTKAGKPLSKLVKAERAISKGALGKSGAVARVLGTRLGARILPALAIAVTMQEVARASQEGIGAYTAFKDLESTRTHMRQKYGTKARAAATRRARTRGDKTNGSPNP